MRLPRKKFKVIYADPPWGFKTFSDSEIGQVPARGEQPYAAMTLDELKLLPVHKLADADGCVLIMWVLGSMLKEAIDLGETWGFTFKTDCFKWRKMKKDGSGTKIGMGYYVRKESETCLLFTLGKAVPRASKGVREIIDAPVREHSRKPEEAYERIEALFGDVSRIEMFGRCTRPGWDSWGNETTKFDRQVAPRSASEILGPSPGNRAPARAAGKSRRSAAG